ncbi:MAG TPA: transglutaminase domain-containing protein [Pyrinomonadaceae bacterium]|nr:transglutaminase domain-containing protein [Pyrinomonadaceae bacterium]
MRKIILLLLLIFVTGVVSNAQVNRVQARDAEWKSYQLPKTNFARQMSPDKEFIFRVPADWKQQGTQLVFEGPHTATLQVFIEKVADGYPLQDLFATILQTVKDTPGAAETVVTRKTQLQDLEARELVMELPDDEGDIFRSTAWVTVAGPLAITFNLKVPAAHAAEVEPFFKAVVQSVIFVPRQIDFNLFQATSVKTSTPGPIHEIEDIVASLKEAGADREAAVTRLATLFSSHADVTMDLLLDRRPLVRLAAVQALAKTKNSTFAPFLWEILDDREPLVAEAAARAVAGAPDVVAKTLEHSMSGFSTNVIARVWPFMPRDKRTELLQKIFSKTATPRTPPPPAAPRPKKPGVSVKVTEMTALRPGELVADVVAIETDPNVQIGALTLLTSISPEEFKLPLARVMEAKYDPMIVVALQVANARGEALPLDALMKLAVSSNEQVSKLAIQSLAFSAAVSDITRIEALISKNGSKQVRDEEVKLTVKKIRFRNELTAAKTPAQSREIIAKGMSDSSLANFAWRFDCESSISGCTPQTAVKRDLTVKPFGENLFPQKMRHFTAVPNPREAVQKFYATFHGLQLDSPRAQSNLAMVIGGIREHLGRELSAPLDATSLIEYTGIDPETPIAFGAWTAAGAPDSVTSAHRNAIMLRVKDRGRFERVIEKFQQGAGAFTDLTDTIAVSTRAIAALPAILPFTAQAILATDLTKNEYKGPLLQYSFVTEKEWNGLPIKTIEHRWVSSTWEMQSASTHIVVIGDTVLLTPDLATIRDLLTNVNSETHLAENPDFRKAIESRGDVVYFSDLAAALGRFSGGLNEADFKATESGALNISGSSWENSHHFVFKESEWAKSVITFHPKELSAPRDLLPASTIAYVLTKLDFVDMLARYDEQLPGNQTEDIEKFWALDFAKEVLPELGPECGFVLLELPDVKTFSGGTWAGFCKLKSNKLAEALTGGKLVRGVGPTTDIAEVKDDDTSYFVAVRNGFLVVSGSSKGLAAFDGKSNLASARDYSRAVEKVPGGIVAFGGYNLEASVAAASKTTAEGIQQEIANVLFSVSSAFHSQNFYATATAGTVAAHTSVAMDREGRYPVAELSYLPRGTNITYMTLEPTGVPITDQKRLSSMVVRVRAKTPGPIDNIKNDIKTDNQTVEQKAPNELLLTIGARRNNVETPVQLPVKDPALEPFLKATREFASDNQQVKQKALEIAGKDKDAWSVARKLADWTYENLEWKLVASANAATTLATREADCTEFSQLFIAMARSLGLPARMVEGIAFSGNSFGGHAWVEVWVGKWVELDPTWGTHFVDATHIRSSSNAIITSAALNMIDIEIVETKRTIADFQKNPRALAEQLAKALANGDNSDLQAALDLTTLTDEFMAPGTWAKMNEREREQMSSAYRRLLNEIGGFKHPSSKIRLVHLQENGDHAEAICISGLTDMMLRLQLIRRNDVWYLKEVIQADDSYHVAAETLRPSIDLIQKARAGEKTPPLGVADFVRVLTLVQNESQKTIAVVDGMLKNKPKDSGLRFLKALAQLNDEEREADGVRMLHELAGENFAPAVLRLGRHYNWSDDKEETKKSIAFYERYMQLEPHDPRAHSEVAEAYDVAGDVVKAEAGFRKAIEMDPSDPASYESLIGFLIRHDRVAEVKPWLEAGEKHSDKDDDLFGWILQRLSILNDFKNAEALAASEPGRLKSSFIANLTMARIYSRTERYPSALRHYEVAAQLDKKSSDPYAGMAMVHRKQARWSAALQAAQKAIDLNYDYSEGYYQRACALARLGKIKEAMSSLEKAVELDSSQVDFVIDEEDLKPLASLPAFKKLIPEPVKQ